MRAIVLPLVCLLVTGVAAAERHWQTGTWGDVATARQMIDFGPGQSSFGPPNAGVPMRALAEVRVFVIETDDTRYELRDTVPITHRSIDVVVGGPVTFAVEKNTVYVRDQDGTEHKLRLTKKTATSASPAPSANQYAALGGGHLLRETSEHGRFLMLEDGSRWEIHPRDRYQTADWDANASLTVRTTRAEDGYGYEIVNTQTDEGALARFVPRR
ncbi:MAG TPA: hypothetical protein VFA27_11830 [Vicinamibacterales bacterium]|nr:hypothetical protein [Vicinamibacterales bacterium]